MLERIGRRAAIEIRSLVELRRAGLLAPLPPREGLAVARAFRERGQLGAAITAAALRHGERTAIQDELGSLSFAELDRRSDALACALYERGVRGDGTVGLLCRNHRGLLDGVFAAAKLRARLLLLNTDFAGPQLRDVCAREAVSLLIHDQEYEQLVEEIETGRLTEDAVEELIAANLGCRPPVQSGNGAIVLLTSGTTGSPKGAPRSTSPTLHPLGALLSKVPYRAGESTYVAAPMFHGLGFTQAALAVMLGSTILTHRRFVPERVLDTIHSERPTGLVLVPVMLQRIVSLLEANPGRWSTDSLRVVFLSGAQLEAELVRRAHRAIGEKLYNFYGSTEVAWATFATPEDLREAPGTAGRPPFGTLVRLYDSSGRPAHDGPGRIFVGNGFQFEGYTGGGGKEMIDGLMSTGDVGHFDEAGRLFIDGRDDEMIISGGENVFPAEVEELLLTHEAVEEAAVIGVPDDEFGQRLKAFVVPRDGQDIAEPEIQDFIRANLARYKVPREVVFLPELPRNPTGKVLKRELRAL